MPNVVRIPVAAGAFDPTDIEITDNTSGAWLIKDDSGSPTEYMRIDTTSGAELTQFVVPDDGASYNKFVIATERTNSRLINVTPRRTGLSNIEGVFFEGDATTQIWVNGPNVFRIQNGGFTNNLAGTQSSSTYLGGTGTWGVSGPSGTIAQIEPDSTTTFTLEQSGSNYFTVKNDASASHCFRVNGNNRHTEIERIGFAGQQYIGYSGDYIQRSQPACIDGASHTTSPTTLAVPDMGGSPGSGTFNNINRRTAIRIHSASQSASGDLFTATLNVGDAYDELIREMFLYVSNYDSTNNFALKIQASAGSGNWRELNSSGITSASGQTIDAATTYIYRIFQYAPGGSTATRVYGINFMGKMAH